MTDQTNSTLCSSKFTVRVYQDLGEESSTTKLELPKLTEAIFAYDIDDGSNTFNDDFFPDNRVMFDDDEDDEDDEDTEWPPSDMDDDEDDYESEELVYQVTVSYAVTADVLKEIRGAFPLPSDADLVFEITHSDDAGNPVYKHIFRGWPHHDCSHSASRREPAEMVHRISLQCEDVKMFQVPL